MGNEHGKGREKLRKKGGKRQEENRECVGKMWAARDREDEGTREKSGKKVGKTALDSREGAKNAFQSGKGHILLRAAI